MIYVRKVAGFDTKDLARRNDKKYFKRIAKEVSPLNKMFERRTFRDQLAEKASDKKGITVNEMADISVRERYDKGDRINKKESRGVAEHFEISKQRLMKARNRYFSSLNKSGDKGIARPYGQRDNSNSPVSGKPTGLGGSGSSTPRITTIPRRPMF